MHKINVVVSCQSDYQINWHSEHIPRKLSVVGWVPQALRSAVEDAWPKLGIRWGWVETATVDDGPVEADQDTMFVVVFLSGYYDGHVGGSSWYARQAFVDREKAEAYAEETNRHKYQKAWVVVAHRLQLADLPEAREG